MVERLIIHAGLHKTGTTAFQLLCHRDSEALLADGVYVARSEFPDVACPFEIAFDFQVGDFRRFGQVIDAANAAGARTALISAEDFSFCLSDPALSARLETYVARMGVKGVVWAFGLRQTSDYFWSLHAETAKHGIFAQSLTWFDRAMREGFLVEPVGEFHGYHGINWFFPFDQIRIISEFERQVSGTVLPFWYNDAPLMPGLQILAEYGLEPSAFAAFVARNASHFDGRPNARLEDSETIDLAVKAFLARLPADLADGRALAAELASGYFPSEVARSAISRALDERFGDVRAICRPPTYHLAPDPLPQAQQDGKTPSRRAAYAKAVRDVWSNFAAKFQSRP
jgi:hypothetical protein